MCCAAHWALAALSAHGRAIVASPIPSGAIAMATGALYGTVEGGVFTLGGASCGAMIAFLLSQHLASATIAASSNSVATCITRERSPVMLIAMILVSQLIRFISFDAISYAAGLTRLEAWRFAVAMLLGMLPVTFARAAVGNCAVS